MKKRYVLVVSLIMCVALLLCSTISISAVTEKNYSGQFTKGGINYFDGQVSGRLYNDTSSSYVSGSTKRESAGSSYTTVYVKVYFEYPDGEYYPSWNASAASTVTTSTYDPGYIYAPDDVSSLHTIYKTTTSSSPGDLWLGAHTH